MCSCGQSLVALAFLWEKLSQPHFFKDLTRKTAFSEGCAWFKYNNLGLALSTNLKFYTSVAKGLKLKSRKFIEGSPYCEDSNLSWQQWASILVGVSFWILLCKQLKYSFHGVLNKQNEYAMTLSDLGADYMDIFHSRTKFQLSSPSCNFYDYLRSFIPWWKF